MSEAATLAAPKITRPAREVLEKCDGPDTLHYVDPPYPFVTRSDGAHRYRHEMTDSSHYELAEVLRGLRGMAIVLS